MRWSYDVDTRILDVHLRDARPGWRVVMADGVLVDVDRTGRALSIEVSDPNAGWDVAAVTDKFELTDDVVATLWASTTQ